MPSTERTVRWGSVWVDKANWCGEQARWIGEAKCWAMLRDTTLRRMSPMTIPRTRPFGFCSATMRPNPRAVAVGGGMLAAASCCATWTNVFVLSSSSSKSRNVSAVRPDGPGAAPLRVRRRLRMMVGAGICKAVGGVKSSNSWSMGWYWLAGRRAGSRSSFNVSRVRSASGLCNFSQLSTPALLFLIDLLTLNARSSILHNIAASLELACHGSFTCQCCDYFLML